MNTPEQIKDVLEPSIVAFNTNVAYPNIEAQFDTEEADQYLRVSYLTSRSETATYGTNRIPSILQIDVVVKSGTGTRQPIIDEILTAFAFNTIFESKDAKVRIDKSPYEGTSFNINGKYITPINIPFEVYR